MDREDSQWKNIRGGFGQFLIDLINFDFTREIVQQIDSNVSSLALATEEKSLENIFLKLEIIYPKVTLVIKNIQEFEASDIQEIYLTTLTHMFDPHTVFFECKRKRKV